jgi:hypothetical protein
LRRVGGGLLRRRDRRRRRRRVRGRLLRDRLGPLLLLLRFGLRALVVRELVDRAAAARELPPRIGRSISG